MRSAFSTSDWSLVFTGYIAGALIALVSLQIAGPDFADRLSDPSSPCQTLRTGACAATPNSLPHRCAIALSLCHPERV